MKTVNWTTVVRSVIVFTAAFVTGAFGFILPALGARLSLVLLPSGLAVAATIRWGRRMWPAILLAGVAINLTRLPSEWLIALFVGAGFAASSVASAWLLQRQQFDPSFSRSRDVLAFFGAALAGMTLAPSIGMLGLLVARSQLDYVTPVNWIRWWSNIAAGVFLATPMLIAWNRHSLARLAAHWGTGAVWLLALAGCVAAILFAPAPLGRAPIAVFAMVLIVFGTIRFGLVVAAAGALILSAATAFDVAFARGAFGGGDQLAGLVTVWSFIGALVSTCLLVTALLAERETAATAKLRAERRYAQIFDGSPQPLWVHDPSTFRFLLVNEAAVRQYGWNRDEFQAQSVDALAAAAGEPVLPPPASEHAAGAEPFETRHRTRDGRIIDVEVWTRSIDLDGHAADLVFAIDVTERRALGRAVLEAITGEQRRIGQEMHDGLGQELTGVALSLRALSMQAEREKLAIAADIAQLADMVSGCIESTRLIVRGLSPLSDADGNLLGALEALAQTSSLSGTRVRLRTRPDALLTVPLETRSHLLRIAQEAVQNALKHAGARHVDIELWVRPASVMLTIEDDGHGLGATATAGAGLGMRTMQFRAAAIGGRLRVSRRPGGGTAIVCDAPQSVAPAAVQA